MSTPEPVYDRDGITLYHGDCREILPSLELEGFALITDPPYGISHKSNRDSSWKNKQIAGDSSTFLNDWIVEWAVGRGIPWAVFGNQRSVRPTASRGVLIWDKGPASGMGDLDFPWKASWELIYVGGQGWRGKRDGGVLRGHVVTPFESLGRKHQHQKPITLMSAILSKLPREVPIIEPFAGSGSTLVACAKAGRRAVGIEIDPAHIDTAVRRLKSAETPLFAGESAHA